MAEFSCIKMLTCTALVLAGCSGRDMGPISDVFGPDEINQPKTAANTGAANSNPNIIRAGADDTLAAIAARVGINEGELAKHNGLPPTGYRPRAGELILLPRGYQAPGAQLPTVASSSVVEATSLDTGAAEVATAETAAQAPIAHTVEAGETAYSISRLYGVSVTSLANWNQLDGNLTVRTGQVLRIPVGEDGSVQTASVAQPGTGSNLPSPPSAATQLPENTEPAITPASPQLGQYRSEASNQMKLSPPVAGSVSKQFSRDNGGIDYSTASKATVSAANAGTVALVSESIGSLGTVVLIRHENNMMTVYGRLADVAVSKGQNVTRGQRIASTAADSLHFELRRGTESIDPTPYF